MPIFENEMRWHAHHTFNRELCAAIVAEVPMLDQYKAYFAYNGVQYIADPYCLSFNRKGEEFSVWMMHTAQPAHLSIGALFIYDDRIEFQPRRKDSAAFVPTAVNMANPSCIDILAETITRTSQLFSDDLELLWQGLTTWSNTDTNSTPPQSLTTQPTS